MDTSRLTLPSLEPGEDALFLDFDGVLVEIANRPDAIDVPEGLTSLLAELDERSGGAVAIVSGRTMADLERFLPGFSGNMVGSHGAERRGQPPLEPPPSVEALHSDLRRIADELGLLPEFKTRGGALHYREAPDREEDARLAVTALAQNYPDFVVQPAKMAFELKPKGATKDAAVAALMEESAFAGRRPFYLGDDATDEPAMEWVLSAGGVAVKVGSGDSVAPFRLNAPSDVLAWLETAVEGG